MAAETEGGSPTADERPVVRVLVADAPRVVRAGIVALLRAEADLAVIAEAGTAPDALHAIGRIRREGTLALVSLGLPGPQDPYRLIREIRDRHPSIVILATAAEPEPAMVSRALFVGADGFVGKDVPPGEFVEAIRRAARGEVVLAGIPTEWLAALADAIDAQAAPPVSLSERELQVLAVAAEGLTARQIGRRLGVRERTVTTHLHRTYRKLGVGSRLAAVTAAARSGLLSPTIRA